MSDAPQTPSAPAASSSPAPSGGSEAPASTPSSEGSVDTSQDFFAGMSSGDDDVVEVPAAPAEPAAPASKEPAPAAPVAPAPTPAPAAVVPPAAATPPKEQQPPAPAAVAPPAPAPAAPEVPASAPLEATPQSLVEQLAQNQQALIPVVAEQRFKLSKEEADALDLDASAAVPKLLARVYMEAVGASLQHMHNLVPRMIQQQVRTIKATEENETAFYKQFPTIDKAKHHSDVVNFGRAFRATPGISQADLFAMIGAAVMAKHQLPAGAAPVVNGVPALAPPQPAIVTPSAPFVPATGGAHTRIETVDENPFAGLGASFDE